LSRTVRPVLCLCYSLRTRTPTPQALSRNAFPRLPPRPRARVGLQRRLPRSLGQDHQGRHGVAAGAEERHDPQRLRLVVEHPLHDRPRHRYRPRGAHPLLLGRHAVRRPLPRLHPVDCRHRRVLGNRQHQGLHGRRLVVARQGVPRPRLCRRLHPVRRDRLRSPVAHRQQGDPAGAQEGGGGPLLSGSTCRSLPFCIFRRRRDEAPHLWRLDSTRRPSRFGPLPPWRRAPSPSPPPRRSTRAG
ncbi:uncharacterized protein RHOBADRAFT_66733, partial [Rhodotorula graminis WP1]